MSDLVSGRAQGAFLDGKRLSRRGFGLDYADGLDGAAPIIVAAELRRMADHLALMKRTATAAGRMARADGLHDASRCCANRAAELDPPTGGETE